MPPRARSVALAAAVVAAALAAAGCGGGGGKAPAEGGGPAAATVIPASAPVVVSLHSEAFDRLRETLGELGLEQTQQALQGALGKEAEVSLDEIEAAVGEELDVVVLGLEDEQAAVALTQPRDPAKLDALLAKAKAVQAEVGGWVAFAEKQETLDRFVREAAGAKLSTSETYRAATAGLPKDALVSFYADGKAIAEALDSEEIPDLGDVGWVSGAVTAEEKGFGFEARLDSEGLSLRNYRSELAAKTPAGALVFVSFKGIGDLVEQLLEAPQIGAQVEEAEKALGVPLAEVTSLLEGEGALSVRAAVLIPELTAAFKVADERRARLTLERLLNRLAEQQKTELQPTQVDGVAAKKVEVAPFSVYEAVVDRTAVITTAPSGITALRAGGPKLADDPAFAAAKERLGMPDETAGFLFVNIKDSLPLVQTLSRLGGGGETTPTDEATKAFERLRTLLAYATASGSTLTVKGFLEIE